MRKLTNQGLSSGKATGFPIKAHGRQMKKKARSAWLKELKSGHTKSLDAPSWLWNSVVRLVADHEETYLQHCREFALSAETGAV